MRLFLAVWPPDEVLDAVARVATDLRDGLGRQNQRATRWTERQEWHVTLRFLGEVAGPEPVLEAVHAAAPEHAEAQLGLWVQTFGRSVAHLPVTGLDELATQVTGATARLGEPPDDRGFTGHITLARAKRRQKLPRKLPPVPDGTPVQWLVNEIALVQSHDPPHEPRYETLSVIPLSGS